MQQKSSKRPCMICLSPYRSEVVRLFKQGVNTVKLYNKYASLMNYTATSKAFYMILRKHVQENHNVDAMVIPTTKMPGVTPTTIEDFGKRMLELGMAKVEGMTPGEVALKDVIQAQKLVLDSKRLKITEDAMMVMLGKLFGPQLTPMEKTRAELAEVHDSP